MIRQNQIKQATIQRPTLPFLFAFVLFALCCLNSLQAYAQTGRTDSRSRNEIRHPLAEPLAKDDPRAQISSELKNALPLPTTGQVNPNVQAEDTAQGPSVVDFNLQTRQESRSQGNMAAEAMQDELRSAPTTGFRGPREQAEQSDKPSQKTQTSGVDQAESCADRWQPYYSTWSYPMSAQVKLFMTFPNGYTYVGSGTMIGSKYVITSSNNLYQANFGGWAVRIEAVPGLSGYYAPFGSAFASRLRTFTDGYSRIGLLTLDRHIGYSTGWFGYGTFSDYYLSSSWGQSFGYPADRNYGRVLYYNYGDINYINRDWLSVGVTFHPGLMGSGLYLRDYYGDRYVFGVTQDNWYCGSWGSRLTDWVKGQVQYVISYSL